MAFLTRAEIIIGRLAAMRLRDILDGDGEEAP